MIFQVVSRAFRLPTSAYRLVRAAFSLAGKKRTSRSDPWCRKARDQFDLPGRPGLSIVAIVVKIIRACHRVAPKAQHLESFFERVDDFAADLVAGVGCAGQSRPDSQPGICLSSFDCAPAIRERSRQPARTAAITPYRIADRNRNTVGVYGQQDIWRLLISASQSRRRRGTPGFLIASACYCPRAHRRRERRQPVSSHYLEKS